MKFIINIIRKHISIISNDIPRPLGRWGMDSCNKKMNNKIDLANEDNCGPCGQYAMSKNGDNLKKIDSGISKIK